MLERTPTGTKNSFSLWHNTNYEISGSLGKNIILGDISDDRTQSFNFGNDRVFGGADSLDRPSPRGLSILLGFKAGYDAWLIVICLVPIAVVEPMMRQVQQINFFMHNLALLGAALMIAHFGSGPLSVDKK